MTKYLLGAATAALLLAVPGAASAQRATPSSILIVDTDRVLATCTACVAATAQLQAQGQAFQTRQQQIQAQLRTEGAPIQTAVNALNGRQPDPALQTRITGFQTHQNQLAQELQGRQQTLESTQQNVSRQIGERLIAIVEQVRAQHGATVAIAKGSTLANDNTVDVTSEVLTLINQQLPSVSVTPLPAPPPGTQPQGR
jgi:Skp family chaperone for outer membrane proteins